MNSIQAASASRGPQKQKEIDRNAVRQALNSPLAQVRPLMLMEGDDDVNFYKKCLTDEAWRFKSVSGCDVVIEFLNEFVPYYGLRICGVIDSDFRRLNHPTIPFNPAALAPNLYVTDLHDWENWMVCDREIERFWNSRMDRAKYTMPPDILTRTKSGIRNLSILKWYHSRRKWEAEANSEEKKEGYSFRKCKMEHCFEKSLEECRARMKSTQKNDDFKLALEEGGLAAFAAANPAPDENQLYVGHDLCDGVVFIMKKHGTPKPQITDKCFPAFLIEHGSKDRFFHSSLNSDLTLFHDSFTAAFPSIAG